MSKVILLGSKNAGEKNDVTVLVRDLHEHLSQHDIRTVYFEDLLFVISNQNQSVIDSATGEDISETDLVITMNWYRNGQGSIYRDVAYSIALYLEKHGLPFWNSEMRMQRSSTKLSAMMQLALNGIDIPGTTYSLNPKLLLENAQGFPLVAKGVAASRGRNNYLCRSDDELRQYVGRQLPNKMMLQEYLENDRDWRIVCAGGQPRMVIERKRSTDTEYLNNVSQGATATELSLDVLDAKTVENCKQICHVMGREIAGIDVLPVKDGSNRIVFLEVNAIPQLTSGALTSRKTQILATAIDEQLKDTAL